MRTKQAIWFALCVICVGAFLWHYADECWLPPTKAVVVISNMIEQNIASQDEQTPEQREDLQKLVTVLQKSAREANQARGRTESVLLIMMGCFGVVSYLYLREIRTLKEKAVESENKDES